MACVTFEHVSKTFRDRKGDVGAVVDLNLSVADGELLVMVGPSGCGKTTALRLLAGLEAVTAGTIHIGDRIVNEIAPKDRDIAMVFQHYALYPHMTVFKNLAFGLKMRRVPKGEILRRVNEVAGVLGLDSLLDRKPTALSGGERQRVALGRAIVRTPQVFLFDEPLSNLDAGLRLEMRTEIKRLHAKLATTTIHVTHDQEEAMTLGDRVVVLREGVVQQVGEPLEVYAQPANRFVAGFIGSPPMNFLRGSLKCADGALRFRSGMGRIEWKAADGQVLWKHGGEDVLLGIRAEDLRLVSDQDEAARGVGADGPCEPVSLGEMSVQALEPLGDRLRVHLAGATGESVVATVSSTMALKCGQEVMVTVDGARLHVFSASAAGERLL